jgi:hypothetical protein
MALQFALNRLFIVTANMGTLFENVSVLTTYPAPFPLPSRLTRKRERKHLASAWWQGLVQSCLQWGPEDCRVQCVVGSGLGFGLSPAPLSKCTAVSPPLRSGQL